MLPTRTLSRTPSHPTIRSAVIGIGLGLLLLGSASGFAAEGPLAEQARRAYAELESRWTEAAGLERAELTLQLGVWVRDPSFAGIQPWNDRSEALYELALLDRGHFQLEELPAPIAPIMDQHISSPHWTKGLRDLRVMQLHENFDAIAQSYFQRWHGLLDDVRLLADGDLAARQHQLDSALVFYQRSLAFSDSGSYIKHRAQLGIGQVLYRQRHFKQALDTLRASLANGGLSGDLLYEIGATLVRLGRVREAVELFELTLTINPYHERAHYMLGNGYTPLTYEQLTTERPDCFPDEGQARTLRRAARLLARGLHREARDLAEVVLAVNEGCAPGYALAAESAWLMGEFDQAEELCLAAIDHCPEYGRIHAIFARLQESRRLRASPRRLKLRDRAIDTPMPEVANIGRYVINWEDLARRHRKQVALSVEPWAHFVPVLVASGATHYIKPLHQRLSETPHMETLRGQRIGLDSRLWDDVRGAGGHHTVTGVEDVNRSLYGGYNTVVHELTHQVHGLLTEPEKQRIEALYRSAKERDAEGTATFLSRYQASTVWEYFAEGVNAYVSPRIDAYDEREMVRERLEALDPELLALVEHFLSVSEMRPYYAVGAVNRAWKELEVGKPQLAWEQLDEIETEFAEMRAVLDARARIAAILDLDSTAVATARHTTLLYPRDGESHIALAEVLRTDDRTGAGAVSELLETALAMDSLVARHDVHLALAGQLARDGRFELALSHYDSVLAVSREYPAALWGRAEALAEMALAGQPGADSLFLLADSAFHRAIELRSGWTGLRLSYARILIERGQLELASEQIDEAEALRPDAPEPAALRAWLFGAQGDSLEARIRLRRTLTSEPVPDFARVLASAFGISEIPTPDVLAEQLREATPVHVFNPRNHAYELRGVWQPWYGRLLAASRPARFPAGEDEARDRALGPDGEPDEEQAP